MLMLNAPILVKCLTLLSAINACANLRWLSQGAHCIRVVVYAESLESKVAF